MYHLEVKNQFIPDNSSSITYKTSADLMLGLLSLRHPSPHEVVTLTVDGVVFPNAGMKCRESWLFIIEFAIANAAWNIDLSEFNNYDEFAELVAELVAELIKKDPLDVQVAVLNDGVVSSHMQCRSTHVGYVAAQAVRFNNSVVQDDSSMVLNIISRRAAFVSLESMIHIPTCARLIEVLHSKYGKPSVNLDVPKVQHEPSGIDYKQFYIESELKGIIAELNQSNPDLAVRLNQVLDAVKK